MDWTKQVQGLSPFLGVLPGLACHEKRTVADIVGPWVEPDFNSNLIERCRDNWYVPVGQISNYVLATFIRQQLALNLVLPEAQRRIASGFEDETEKAAAAIHKLFPGRLNEGHLMIWIL